MAAPWSSRPSCGSTAPSRWSTTGTAGSCRPCSASSWPPPGSDGPPALNDCDKTAPGGRSFSCRAAGTFPGDRCLPWRYAPLEAECMLWRKGGLALKALIVWGGWDGHQPDLVAEIFRREIVAMGREAEGDHTLDVCVEKDLLAYDLIIPLWTMGEITPPQVKAVTEAVAAGVGLAGCHGGMCDAFRTCVEWQFMTGGQWVAHPGNDGVEYTVNIVKGSHPIVEGL